LSIDIGGTLAKAAFFIPKSEMDELDKNNQLEPIKNDSIPIELASGDTIFLRSFKSNKIEEFIDFVKKYGLLDNSKLNGEENDNNGSSNTLAEDG
jgi:hypothetical protein